MSLHRVLHPFATLVLLAAAPLSAQAPDSAGFVVLRGADTIAVEHFARTDTELSGELVLPGRGNERSRYRATLAEDATAPLVEIEVWRGEDPRESTPRERTRLIFKDDSVSVDDVKSTGMMTLILPTSRSALPYLNLSFGLLEQAILRSRLLSADSARVPLFNLGGGQTVESVVRRLPSDSAQVLIGSTDFRLALGPGGRILGGTIPSQQVRVERVAR
jgi:hypothetical protein